MGLYLKTTRTGTGVFTDHLLPIGSAIIEFTGPIVLAEQVEDDVSGSADRFLQIDTHTFMGPSGTFDDYVNHSCSPNAGIQENEDHHLLIATKVIPAGTEITWDYSTYICEDWTMRCACGMPNCRLIIGSYYTIPEKQRMRYEQAGIVPDFAKRCGR